MSMVPSSPLAIGISVTSGSTGIDLGTRTCIVATPASVGDYMHRTRLRSRAVCVVSTGYVAVSQAGPPP